MLYRGEEDYIKAIYEFAIEQNNALVKTNQLAVRLNITDQSVNEMVKKLAKKDYLEFVPYKGVFLTKKGQLEAVRLVRAHRIWEVFLVEHLGFSWEQVHKEAEVLEHASSNEVINRIYKLIGSPKYCSHGNPIPDENGKIAKVYNKSLLSFNAGDEIILKRVLDKHSLLSYLLEKNIKIGDKLIIDSIDSNNITFKNNDLVLNKEKAKMMFGILNQ